MKLTQHENRLITASGEILVCGDEQAAHAALKELEHVGASVSVGEDEETMVSVQYEICRQRSAHANHGSYWATESARLKTFTSPKAAAVWLRENEIKVVSFYKPTPVSVGEDLIYMLEGEPPEELSRKTTNMLIDVVRAAKNCVIDTEASEQAGCDIVVLFGALNKAARFVATEMGMEGKSTDTGVSRKYGKAK